LNNDAVALVGVMIPVIAIVLGVGVGMLTIFLDYRRKSEVLKHYHAERMAAIEKGIELPPLPAAFFQQGSREPRPARHRRTGLILLLLGLAIAGAMLGMNNSAFWWGFVPAAIGLAFLISSVLEAREQKQESAHE
jgi:hypothetical protein